MSWSGGKDSTMALSAILGNPNYRVAAVLTTVTEDYDRISMHGVRRSLLRQQVESIGIPLEEVSISKKSSNEEYEANMARALTRYRNLGVVSVQLENPPPLAVVMC
jgi:diphthamide synthase (EF-2-diphthine--ammonia ligase)